MNLDDFRSVLESSGVDIWTLIDAAVTVASVDYGRELSDRRDKIIAKLYTNLAPVCRNCSLDTRPAELCNEHESSPVHAVHRESPELSVDDEKARILEIRQQIHDPDQTEDSLLNLLQTLADMDITFRAVQDTDIGRHVNRLRKHPSDDVRRLVKVLVRKWKELVDEWVISNNAPRDGELQSSALIADGDSPQQYASRDQQNSLYQTPDFVYSPSPHNQNRISFEQESKLKTAPSRREPAMKPKPTQGSSQSCAPLPNKQKEVNIDIERLASARKRLQENYQEAQNAKKQRTIQVMDIHEIPKPKNGFIARNKGGFHGRH